MESCRSTSFAREVFKLINLRCYLNIKNIVEIVQFKEFVVNEAFSLWEAKNMERIHLFCFFLTV